MALGISAGTAWVDVLPNMAKFRAGLAAGMSGAVANAGKVGKKLTRNLTLPIVAAAGASIKMAVDFEGSLDKIEGLVGIARSEVDKMGESVLNLAPKVGKGPKELADALFFITSAGLRGKDALDALEQSAKASTGGLGETKVIANAVTSAMNAYGPANLNAAQATDILTNAVRLGKLEASELAPTIGAILPLAAELGVGFDEVSGALSAMSLTGTNAAKGSTAIQAFFSSLLKETPKTKEALDNVGLSAEQLRDSLAKKGLPATLDLLKESFGGNIKAMAEAFPNIRALRGLLSLTGKNAKNTARVMDGMEKSTGVADSAFGSVARGSGFKFKELLAELQVAGIRLGKELLPIVLVLVKKLTGWIRGFQKLGDTTKKLIGAFVLFLAVLGPYLSIMAKVITVMRLFGVTSLFAQGAVLLIPLALIALGLALVIAWKKSETFRKIVYGVFNAVKGIALAVGKWFAGPFVNFFRKAWDKVTGVFNAVKDWLSRNWKNVLIVLFTGLPGALYVAFKSKFGSALFDKFKSLINRMWKWISDRFNDLVGWFGELPGRMGTAITNAAGRLKSAITDLLKSALPSWAEKALGIASPSKVFENIGNAIIDGLIVGIKSKVGDLKDAALGAVGGFFKKLIGGGGGGGDVLGVLSGFARSLGMIITSTTGGKHAPGSYHYLGRAIDVAGSAAQMRQFFLAALQTFGGSIRELFYDPMGYYIKNGAAVRGMIGDHADHVHLALAKGGIFTKPWTGMVSVAERSPEGFVPLNSSAASALLGSGRRMRLRIENWEEGVGWIEEVADGSTAALADHSQHRGRMNR